jgi:hypothetical protein
MSTALYQLSEDAELHIHQNPEVAEELSVLWAYELN